MQSKHHGESEPSFSIGQPFVTERSDRILLLYIYALPFHSLVLTLLLTAGVPVIFLKALSAWKEVLLVTFFLVVVVKVLSRRTAPHFCWVDGLTFLWLLQILIYCFAGGIFFDSDSTIASRCLAARDWALYLLPYFIGRFTTLSEFSSRKVLRAIVWIGVLTSVVGIIEYAFIPTSWHVTLGVPRYFSELLGFEYPDYLSGLPPNYWAEVAGLPVRRSVSVYLSGQGFAIPFLIIWPAVVAAHIRGSVRHSRWIVVTCAVALLLTITRMTIAACFVETLFLLCIFRKFKAAATIGLTVGLAFFSVFSTNSSFREFVVNTVTFQDTSSSARPGQWSEGFRELEEHPFGDGLTAVGQVSSQMGDKGIGQEAGYLKVINALGVPGTILYLGWFLGVALRSLYVLPTLPIGQATLCIIFVTATVGFMLNNLAAPPDQVPSFIYLFCWLSGFVVQRSVQNIRPPEPMFRATRQKFGTHVVA